MPVSAPNLDPGILQRLGLIVMQWAGIEAQLGAWLAFFLRADPTALLLVTQSVSVATQIGWLRTLAEDLLLDEAPRQEALELLANLDGLKAERNAFAHGIWMPGPVEKTAVVQSVRLDRAEVIRSELVTIPDLDDLCVHLHEANEHLIDVMARMGANPLKP